MAKAVNDNIRILADRMAVSAFRETSEGRFDGLTFGQPRYERKYYITGLLMPEVEAVAKHNPAVFREIFSKRYVNNLYLDLPGRRNYFDGVIGAQERQKVRIRWYGDFSGDIEKPTLEVKLRNGLVGWKRSYPLPPFRIDSGFSFRAWLQEIRREPIPECLGAWLSSYEPTLVNRYVRKYFQSYNKRFRLTIDSELSYGAVGKGYNALIRWANCPDTVLELKYPPDLDLEAAEISASFPFRVTKSSKYIMGIETLWT